MVDPKKRRYIYMSLAVFTAISMSLVLFFILFRLQGIGDALKKLSDILAPFVYGGVVAYLLRPLCNTYESFFTDIFPKKAKRRGRLHGAFIYIPHNSENPPFRAQLCL